MYHQIYKDMQIIFKVEGQVQMVLSFWQNFLFLGCYILP